MKAFLFCRGVSYSFSSSQSHEWLLSGIALSSLLLVFFSRFPSHFLISSDSNMSALCISSFMGFIVGSVLCLSPLTLIFGDHDTRTSCLIYYVPGPFSSYPVLPSPS